MINKKMNSRVFIELRFYIYKFVCVCVYVLSVKEEKNIYIFITSF